MWIVLGKQFEIWIGAVLWVVCLAQLLVVGEGIQFGRHSLAPTVLEEFVGSKGAVAAGAAIADADTIVVAATAVGPASSSLPKHFQRDTAEGKVVEGQRHQPLA